MLEYMHGYGWSGMGFGMFGVLLFWILLIIAIVVFLRGKQYSGVASDKRNEKTALEILKERYARSEIGQDEFENIKRNLRE